MVGRAVATMTESKVETMMQSERPMNTVIIVLNGRRFVWSVKTRCFAGGCCGASLEYPLSSWVDIDGELDIIGILARVVLPDKTAASLASEWVETDIALDSQPS